MEYKGVLCNLKPHLENFFHGRYVTVSVMSVNGVRSVQTDVVNKYVVGKLRLQIECQAL